MSSITLFDGVSHAVEIVVVLNVMHPQGHLVHGPERALVARVPVVRLLVAHKVSRVQIHQHDVVRRRCLWSVRPGVILGSMRGPPVDHVPRPVRVILGCGGAVALLGYPVFPVVVFLVMGGTQSGDGQGALKTGIPWVWGRRPVDPSGWRKKGG